MIALFVILASPLVLVAFLRPALRYADGGERGAWVTFAVVVALVADLIAAHTVWAVVAGLPRKPGEWTISHTLERLCITPGWRQARAIALAKWINSKSPTGRHIKAVAP